MGGCHVHVHDCVSQYIALFTSVQVQGFKPIDVALGTSDRVYYSLTPAQTSTPKKSKDKDVANYGLVVDITRHAGRRVPLVTIRSPLQVWRIILDAES